VVLCGESGCGKTTITRIINGLFPHFYEGTLAGTVTLCGHDAAHMPAYERARLVGSVFQDPRSQFYTTTTTDEVAFGAENLAVGTSTVNARVDALFWEKGLHPLKDRSIFRLSSGEKQEIAIASIRAMQPDIHVFDEPSANLDMAATGELADTLAALKRQGKTVIVSEHRLAYLTDIIDRLIVIQDGEVALDLTNGSWRSLSQTQRERYGLRSLTLEQASIGFDTENNEDAAIGVHIASAKNPARSPLSATPPSPRPSLPPPSSPPPPFPPTSAPPPSSATTSSVQLENLCVGYRGARLLSRLSLRFYPGEIIGIVGKNGVGKTAFARTICGLEQQVSGDIRLSGRRQNRRRQRCDKCGLVMQDADYQLFAESAKEELLLGIKDTAATRQTINTLLEKLGLTELAERHPLSLSGGQKQRLTIGACVAKGADILFMDEPTSGLDGRNMQRLCDLLQELSAQGKTVFVISHDHEFLIRTATRILSFESTEKVEDFALIPSTYSRLVRMLLPLG
ncbi:MAG: energy-coupling factor ABC transporter ATP-binding protein, partial [Coriobacteriales bacterium]|jgi:energy-coupling factor transport system ATP-binding protein|nr:energy-coupling factor ABC transporter ATP-binding protein [Coriobacteriales bacterium]